ncbi:MAG: hypothetical protein KAJ12_01280 [Bacteroidetes bacterium]|nr:hypothetical protein [Bacteroidota bacterium]
MKRLFSIGFGIMMGIMPVRGQDHDSSHALMLYGGAGYTRNISTFQVTPPGLRLDGFVATLRLCWKPEHLLSLGIETGYSHVYKVEANDIETEFGTTSISSSQNAVPILFVVSMEVTRGLLVTGGFGYVLLYSITRAFGTTVSPAVASGGFSLALTKMFPLSSFWGMGVELKWYHFDKFNDDNISVELMVSSRLLQW